MRQRVSLSPFPPLRKLRGGEGCLQEDILQQFRWVPEAAMFCCSKWKKIIQENKTADAPTRAELERLQAALLVWRACVCAGRCGLSQPAVGPERPEAGGRHSRKERHVRTREHFRTLLEWGFWSWVLPVGPRRAGDMGPDARQTAWWTVCGLLALQAHRRKVHFPGSPLVLFSLGTCLLKSTLN